jgi:hypothetical protein
VGVMFQALRDLRDPKYRGGVLRWAQRNERGPRTFLWMCEVLDLKPALIRRRFRAIAHSSDKSFKQ